MKKLMMAMTAALMLSSCTKSDVNELSENSLEIIVNADSIETHKTITFGCNFGVSQELMTRASLSELSLTDLWIFDLPDGRSEPALLLHQTSDDATFGSPSVTAEYGGHTFYFIASRGSDPTINGTTISWDKPSDTFWSTLSLTIVPSTSSTQNVNLQRVAARLRVTITDEVPADLAALNVTPSIWYYGIDYVSGEATDTRTTTRTINVPSSYAGTTGQLAASFYCLSPSVEWTTDVTLTASRADNSSIATISVAGIPMQRNHITSYSGTLFGAGRSISVTADDAWGDDINGTW